MIAAHKGLSLRLLRPQAREGVVLVLSLLVTIVLVGLALVFAREMRVEAAAAANRLAAAQARAIALGAARAVLALGDELPVDAVPVGGGAFWLLQPNFEDDRTFAYGIVDECGKVNLNSAPSEILAALPGMDEAMAAAILDWRDSDDEPQPYGAESDYYLLLPDPYLCKNAPFETVEELLLLRDFTPIELYGEDMNRNGVLDYNENDASMTLPPDNQDGRLDRGLFDFVTVYSRTSLENLINLGTSGGSGTGGPQPVSGAPAAPGGPPQPGGNASSPSGAASLEQALRKAVEQASQEGLLPQDRVEAVTAALLNARPARNLVELYLKSGLKLKEFNAVAPSLTTWQGEEKVGLINVNTAPKEVLAALPGIEESDADALISYRLSAGSDSESEEGVDPLESPAWVAEVLDREKAIRLGDFITTRSDQHSVDIVAVSGDGRAFERYRMVYDTSGAEPKTLLWQRLTHLGWPLDPEILSALRSGVPVEDLPRTTYRGSF